MLCSRCVLFMKRSRRLYSITHRALIRYTICILVLILSVSFFIYATVVRITYKNEEKSLKSIIDQTALVVDHSLTDIQNYMNTLRTSEEFRQFSLKSSPAADSEALISAMQLQRYIKKLSASSPLTKDILLYIKRPNVILTASGQLHLDPAAYFSEYAQSEDVENDFYNILVRRKRAGFYSAADVRFGPTELAPNGSRQNVFVYSSPVFSNGLELGQFLVMFSTASFTDSFMGAIDPDSGAVVSISDLSGNVIAHSENSAAADDRKMFSVTTTTSVYPLKVTISVPNNYITHKTMYLAIELGCVFIFLIISCTLLSYWISRTLGRPFDQLTTSLKPLYPENTLPPKGMTAQTELASIDHVIKGLITDNRVISDSLTQSSFLVKRLFYEELLNGYFRSSAKIDAAMESAGIRKFNGGVRLLYCRFEAETNSQLLVSSGLLRNTLDVSLTAFIYQPYEKINLDPTSFAVLIDDSANDVEKFRTFVAEIRDYFNDHFADAGFVQITLIAGPHISEYMDIGRCFTYMRSLQAAPTENEVCTLLLAEDIRTGGVESGIGYHFTLEEENRLLTCAADGDSESIESIFASILQQVQSARVISLNDGIPLINQLIYSLFRLRDRYTGEDFDRFFDVLSVFSTSSIQSIPLSGSLQLVLDKYMEYCTLVKRRCVSRSEALMNEVRAYIDDHFDDTELTLKKLAEVFCISDAYLSRSFKAYQQVNVMSYLEQVRIRHALQLLKTDASIEEVARSCGFDNVYRFRNAFKRVTNGLPSAFR